MSAKPAHPVVEYMDRQKFLGGSDIPALLGIAPAFWKRNSPVALYYDKITPRVEGEREATGVLRRGKRWESVVYEMLEEELRKQGHTVRQVQCNVRHTDATHPQFRAEIDYEIVLDDEPDTTNVEIKTVHPFKAGEWGESDTDEAPDYVIAQLLWGLGVTRRRQGIIAPLFGADTLKVFPITADQEVITSLRARAVKFWTENVLARVPPDALFLADMGLLYPSEVSGPSVVADEDLIDTLLRMRAIARELKAREAEYDELEFAVQRLMREAEQVVIENKVAATWKARKYAWLDQHGLKAAHPKIHKEFMREGNSRVFILKPFAWKGGE